MKRTIPFVMFFVLSAFQAFSQEAKPDPTLTLKIGAPQLKDKTMSVAPGSIYAADKGAAISFDVMAREMRAARFVYVGETHNSLPMHEVEVQVLRALYGQDPHLAIGLEMLPVTVQESLTKWSLGLLTKDELLRAVRWYVNWNFNFGYYEKIFDFAKEHSLPIYALNVPRETITKIRMKGWEALSEEERTLIPQAPDVSNQDHRTLIRAIFEAADLPHQMKGPGLEQVFEGLYRSQSAWDEVMGANTLRAAEREGRRVVVFAGSGHLLYNLGLNRRAFERSRQPFKTVICVTVPPDLKSVPVARSLGDYIFGLPEEIKPAFPQIGLSFKTVDGLANLVVESKPIDGAANRADFEKGDVILSIDDIAYTDINEARIYLAKFRCGDEFKVRLLRQGAVKDVTVKFDKCPAGPEPVPGEKK
jgi:uncharacterized iron-regulated protein